MKEKDITGGEKLYKIRVNDKNGFIDKIGKVVIEPKYPDAESFSEGLARVLKDKFGFIDKTGKVVIEPNVSFQRKVDRFKV